MLIQTDKVSVPYELAQQVSCGSRHVASNARMLNTWDSWKQELKKFFCIEDLIKLKKKRMEKPVASNNDTKTGEVSTMLWFKLQKYWSNPAFSLLKTFFVTKKENLFAFRLQNIKNNFFYIYIKASHYVKFRIPYNNN